MPGLCSTSYLYALHRINPNQKYQEKKTETFHSKWNGSTLGSALRLMVVRRYLINELFKARWPVAFRYGFFVDSTVHWYRPIPVFFSSHERVLFQSLFRGSKKKLVFVTWSRFSVWFLFLLVNPFFKRNRYLIERLAAIRMILFIINQLGQPMGENKQIGANLNMFPRNVINWSNWFWDRMNALIKEKQKTKERDNRKVKRFGIGRDKANMQNWNEILDHQIKWILFIFTSTHPSISIFLDFRNKTIIALLLHFVFLSLCCYTKHSQIHNSASSSSLRSFCH